jgi:hypothetical protein
MKNNELLVVTMGMGDQNNAFRLKHSCEVYGYELAFYGSDQSFRDFRQTKIDLLLEFLYTVKHKYVMYTDAWDSWFLRGDILEVYKKNFVETVVVSGNRDHYPATNLYSVDDFPLSYTTSFGYICCSQFIGPTKKVIKVLEEIREYYQGYIDQEGWHYCYVNVLADFMIDKQCELFLNMTDVDERELSFGLYLQETGNKPCSIHFGGGKGESSNAQLMNKIYSYWTSSL